MGPRLHARHGEEECSRALHKPLKPRRVPCQVGIGLRGGASPSSREASFRHQGLFQHFNPDLRRVGQGQDYLARDPALFISLPSRRCDIYHVTGLIAI